MDVIIVKTKEEKVDAISCVVYNIQICLSCGSESIAVIDNKIKCNSCGNIKSKCEAKYLV